MLGSRRRVGLYMVSAAALVGLARPDWVSAAGLDVWHLPELRQQLDEAEQTWAELEEENERVDHRIGLKEAMIRELCTGSSTLAETTDRFLRLNHDRRDAMLAIRSLYPSADDREATARNVIGYSDLYPFASPADRAATLGRLHAEFARLFPAAAH